MGRFSTHRYIGNSRRLFRAVIVDGFPPKNSRGRNTRRGERSRQKLETNRSSNWAGIWRNQLLLIKVMLTLRKGCPFIYVLTLKHHSVNECDRSVWDAEEGRFQQWRTTAKEVSVQIWVVNCMTAYRSRKSRFPSRFDRVMIIAYE